MIDYLAHADIEYLITKGLGFDPESMVGDWGLLESALHRPQSTIFGTDAYPDVHTKAAALLHSLARNHAMLDGNKRLSWLATRLFYVRNQLDLRAAGPYAADSLVRGVAAGEYDVETLAGRLRDWTIELAD